MQYKNVTERKSHIYIYINAHSPVRRCDGEVDPAAFIGPPPDYPPIGDAGEGASAGAVESEALRADGAARHGYNDGGLILEFLNIRMRLKSGGIKQNGNGKK